MSRIHWEKDEDVDLECIPPERHLRIRQERVKHGLTEKELASELGISWQRMRAIENGTGNEPDLYLISAMGVAGMDIQYILLGKKVSILKSDEAALLDNYRNTTPERKASLREVGAAFAEPSIDSKTGTSH